ncbi:MAG: hypothetical protein AB4042_13845 [Leptolyngbyaceae cyanobacterium]
MVTEQFLIEIGTVVQTQNHLLNQLKAATGELNVALTDAEQKLANTGEMNAQIQELERLMAELEADQEWVETGDVGDFDPDQVLSLYQNRQQSVFQDLTKIGFKDWDSFVWQCKTHALSQGIDPLAPYESLLSEADLKQLKTEGESYKAQYKWDKWDYIFVGASGVLAALTDYLLVKIPATLKTGEFAGQTGSPLTTWLKNYNIHKSDDWFAQWARTLEDTCKVPYDQLKFAGMTGRTHRLQSFGHDPVLGFVFGILDIMRGSITGFSYDKLAHSHTWTSQQVVANSDIDLISAFLKQFGHLISDVATPMGLPAPFMTLIQGINAGSFGEKNRTVGEVARWMYLNGYDFRHFLVSGMTPAVIEIMLRTYMMLRHYSEHGETKFDLASHPKYRMMLLIAHGIATLGNAGKITLMQGNPLAINYAEWLALIRYLVPSLKYWIFDQHRLQLEHLESINSAGWDELLQNGDRLLTTITPSHFPTITLGQV